MSELAALTVKVGTGTCLHIDYNIIQHFLFSAAIVLLETFLFLSLYYLTSSWHQNAVRKMIKRIEIKIQNKNDTAAVITTGQQQLLDYQMVCRRACFFLKGNQ